MSTRPIELPALRPPEYYGPFEARAKLANLQNLAQQQQIGAQQLQVGQMSIEDHQRAVAQRKAIDQAYRDSFTIGEDGTPQLDIPKFSQALATGGHGSAIPGILEGETKLRSSYADLREKQGKVAAAEQEAAGTIGATMQSAKYDPHVFLTFMTHAVHNGALTQSHVKPLMDNVTAALEQDPTGEQARALVEQYSGMMVAGSNKQRELQTARMTAESTAALHKSQAALADVETQQKREMGPIQVRKTGLEADELQRKLDMIKNTKPSDVLALVDQVVPPDVKANHALNLRTKFMVTAKLNQGDFAGAQDVIKTAASEMRQLEVATDPRIQAGKVAVTVAGAAGRANAVADAAGLTEDDYQRAGEQYIRTGVMPALGRDSVTRARIVKAGNQFARDNGLNPQDVVTMQAAYAGDKDSLKKFQAQRDQIVSFEQTAQKNLDLFLNLASKIPDTGVPWLNKPLRELNANLIGSENMAAVNAARNIANNEIAKVTSGGGLGGVLSDSARHEVAGYNPANATFAQTKAVANILKQDMANRHGAMDATLSEIKARIGGGTGAATETPKGKGTHRIRVNGKLYDYNGTGDTADMKNYTEVKNP